MSFLSKVEEPTSKQKHLHCPICNKSFTNDNNREDWRENRLKLADETQDALENTSHIVVENICRAQCLGEKLVTSVCEPKSVAVLILEVALDAYPEAKYVFIQVVSRAFQAFPAHPSPKIHTRGTSYREILMSLVQMIQS